MKDPELLELEVSPEHRHVSWSQYRIWKECQHLHWLQYKEKMKSFDHNKYVDFGSAVHYTAEDFFRMKTGEKELNENFDHKKAFSKHLFETINENVDKYSSKLTETDLDELECAGKECVDELLHFITNSEEFQGWEIYAVEYDLDLPISDNKSIPDWKFKGYIDLVLKKGNKYYLLDYKTCSWGWGKDKLTNPLYMGQLHAYKNYFIKTHPEIKDSKDVKMAFVLVKRTAKNTKRIQLLSTHASQAKLEEVEKELSSMALAFQKGIHMKTGRANNACGNCSFFGTEHCPIGK